MAIIEGTGIKAAGSEAQKKAKKVAQVYYGGPEAENRRRIKSFLKEFGEKSPLSGGPGGVIRIPDMVPKASIKGDETFEKKNFFSPDGGAFDKRNNVEVATTNLSGLVSDSNEKSESTFGTSFTDQASANIADASIYKQKEDNIYRDTTDPYKDFKSIYKKDSTEDTVKSIEKFYNLDPKGVKYTPRDESQFGGEVLKGAFPGQEDRVISTKEKITGVKDFGYMKGDQLFGTFRKQEGGLGIGVGLDQNKYGLVPRLGGLGGLYSTDDVTQSYVKAMMQNKADTLDAEMRNNIDKIKNPQNYNEDGSLKTLDQKYGSFLNEKDKAEKKYANQLGYNTYADYQKAREEKSNEIDSKLKAAFTKKEEKKEPSVLQKVGNFLGSVTNTVLGIQPAQGSQIGGSLPNTGQSTTTGDTTPRQTVASLPSDYKQTEAREFAKAAAFQQAKKNPNVTVGVDSKGQPVAKAVQKTRTEAGTSARTAEGNQARVKQNAVARAQAAAINRKISGKSISQTKAANRASMKKAAAARNASFQARKKAGKLSKSERTAKGQRAAKKAAAKKRAQNAAKARRKKKSKGKK